jgi:hypothetical protein
MYIYVRLISAFESQDLQFMCIGKVVCDYQKGLNRMRGLGSCIVDITKNEAAS